MGSVCVCVCVCVLVHAVIVHRYKDLKISLLVQTPTTIKKVTFPEKLFNFFCVKTKCFTSFSFKLLLFQQELSERWKMEVFFFKNILSLYLYRPTKHLENYP